ncbi:MAG: dethiobiotin synthase [Campylobacterales bacterium]|nr:dethiobiotin synthase [Campylobacterales bacterium]
MSARVFFVSGIDTDIGKTYATGYLARLWNDEGIVTLTQKPVQTGVESGLGDIATHCALMGTPLPSGEEAALRLPQVFAYPASPHFAAQKEGKEVDVEAIDAATAQLALRCERLLLEGAGGLMVPLTPTFLQVDFIAQRGYEVILVTSGRLGSINHTLLSLEALHVRGLKLHTLVFNEGFSEENKEITSATQVYFQTYLSTHFPQSTFITLPFL